MFVVCFFYFSDVSINFDLIFSYKFLFFSQYAKFYLACAT